MMPAAQSLLQRLMAGEPMTIAGAGPIRELMMARYVIKVANGYVVTRDGIEAAKENAA